MGKSKIDMALTPNNRDELYPSIMQTGVETMAVEISNQEVLSRNDFFYYTVGAITYTENFFRALIKTLIDESPDFAINARDLLETLSKKDLTESLLAIVGKRISFGELISAIVPISSVTQIFGYLDRILGKSVKTALSKEVKNSNFRSIGFNLDDAISSLDTLYNNRHILCHENVQINLGSKNDLEKHLQNISDLFELFEVLQHSVLDMPWLMTQLEMNNYAYGRANNANEELEKYISDIQSRLKSGDSEVYEDFENAQKAWCNFVELDSQSYSNDARGGSMQPLLFQSHRYDLICDRLEYLKKYWSDFLDKRT